VDAELNAMRRGMLSGSSSARSRPAQLPEGRPIRYCNYPSHRS